MKPARARLAATPFDLLLPYQRQWVTDRARFKIWLKSRQIGGSLAAAFEIVADALETGMDWIVLSAGERQALEFMQKVHRVAGIFADAIAAETGKPFAPTLKAESVAFPNGARILALPANPATARGYSGNLLLDEFAFHRDPAAIWAAVFPIITNPLRGALKIRIISTPAGLNSKFADLWHDGANFSRHKTDIYEARDNGLDIDIDALRDNLDDPDAWEQEYECGFMESDEIYLPLELIRSAEDRAASLQWPGAVRGPLYLGIDIGRRRDLTVAWTVEALDGALWTREVLVLERTPYHEQEEILAPRIDRARHTCIDTNGIGDQIAETFQRKHPDRVTRFNVTNTSKNQIFTRLKKHLGAGTFWIPPDKTLRDDLNSVHRIVTKAGVVKFTARHTSDGHADRANAAALATEAHHVAPPPVRVLRDPILIGGRDLSRPLLRTRFRRAWAPRR
ncbi:MAG: terminase family protein [Opitutales bacterium]|nr:terminase family protein [Opitutales bacterium]